MSTLIFLYGEDSYRLHKRLQQLREEIGAGDFNVSQIDAQENWDSNRFENELTAVGFFGGSRLVIVKNLLATKDVDAEKVIGLLSVSPPPIGGVPQKAGKVSREQRDSSTAVGMTSGSEVTVIIVETVMPDKRIKLYKWLQKNAGAEEFSKLSGSEWIKFASGLITESKIKISGSARQRLMGETEGDSWQLVNVLDQLSLWRADTDNHPLQIDDINLFVRRKLRGNSFQLLDAINRGQTEVVTHHLKDLWAQGEAPLRVLGAIVYQYRQLVLAKAALEEGLNNYQIIRELKIPPFVAQKVGALARATDWSTIKEIYNHIAQIDEQIKSGKIEPEAGIEILIYNLLQIHQKSSQKISLSGSSSL